MYTQCGLRRVDVILVSWIPEKFAIVGKVLKLKNNDKWSDGWIIEWTGFTQEILDTSSQRIKKHRKNTGDSLPKIKPRV